MPTFEEIEQQREARDKQAASERQRLVAAQQQIDREKQHSERLREKLLAIMWAEVGASPAEISRVTSLLLRNKPEQINNISMYRMMLLELRALTEVSQKLGQ